MRVHENVAEKVSYSMELKFAERRQSKMSLSRIVRFIGVLNASSTLGALVEDDQAAVLMWCQLKRGQMAKQSVGLMFVFGTRPEAIKLGPVVAELRELVQQPYIVCTGQHVDLLRGTPAETDLAPDRTLGIENDGSPLRFRAALNSQLVQLLKFSVQPQVLVVQGDTSTAAEAANVASFRKIPLAHVEAGVRSHAKEPWPEELNRREIDQLSKWHYCATETNRQNLATENLSQNVVVTGNSGVSALWRYAHKATKFAQKGWQIGNAEDFLTDTVVITLHRREIQGAATAAKLALALAHEVLKRPNTQFLWLIHPALARYLDVDALAKISNLTLSEPVPYKPFVELVARAKGVITDSGGLVEDCATLGTPCAILRDHNDRPEALETGQAAHFPLIAGCFARACEWIEGAKRLPASTFGDQDSAKRIAEHLAGLVQ